MDLRLQAARELRRRHARRDLLAFTKWTKRDYQANWHHVQLASALSRWARREGPRNILVKGPPRHGKTELAGRRLPAYILGLHPNDAVLSCTHTASQAEACSRDVLSIIRGDKYKELFPLTTLHGDERKRIGKRGFTKKRTVTEWSLANSQGSYYCSGVGGPIGGRGADWLILDDYLKNSQDAASDILQERQWEWFTTSFWTRRSPKASLVINSTTWRSDDLVGRVEEHFISKFPEEWIVIHFPAISADTQERVLEENHCDPRGPNEPLWPSRFGDKFYSIAESITENFDALWNSRFGHDDSKSIVKEGWIKRYRDLPEGSPCCCYITVDANQKKTKSGSRASVSMWLEYGEKSYLYKDFCESVEYVDLLDKVKSFILDAESINVQYEVLIEEGGNGYSLISTLKEGLLDEEGFRFYPKVVPIKTGGKSKSQRLKAATPAVRSGKYSVALTPWGDAWLKEVTRFPALRRDDRVDSFSQYVNYRRGSFVAPLVDSISPDEYNIEELELLYGGF